MDHIARIEQELDSFPDTLTLYRQQLKRWFSQAADKVSRATDMPSLMGMERVITLGTTRTVVSSGDDDFISTVAQCAQGGVLQIESKFESVYDVPLGNIQVDVIALEGGGSTPVTLDENGKGEFRGEAGKFYRVRVQSEVTPEQVDELFNSYDGLTAELDKWLRGEWDGFKPQWSQSTSIAVGNGMLAGSWAAIEGVWDGINLISDILKNPGEFVDRLGSSADQLIELAKKSPDVMSKIQLLASDEAALCLLLRTASLWLEMLPPSLIAGETAKAITALVVELLIDILIAIVLTFAAAGAGVAYLTMRLARRGAQLINAVTRLVGELFKIINTFIGYIDRYKKVAVRGVAAGLKKGRMQLRWNARNNTVVKKDEHHDDASKPATNPNGDSADSADRTTTHGCPVSMV
ncbi:type IV secretion protein Rhs, partial [Pseudomonas fluorescens]